LEKTSIYSPANDAYHAAMPTKLFTIVLAALFCLTQVGTVLAQPERPPSPSDRGSLVSLIVAILTVGLIALASFLGSKRSHQD